jgi:hypothetical protein
MARECLRVRPASETKSVKPIVNVGYVVFWGVKVVGREEKGGRRKETKWEEDRGVKVFFFRLNWAPVSHVTRVVTELGPVAAELPPLGSH